MPIEHNVKNAKETALNVINLITALAAKMATI
jgi:hypothetical protein